MNAVFLNAEGAKVAEGRREVVLGTESVQRFGYETVNGRGKRVMHENEISRLIIGAAIEVHKELGPGLIEKVYEESLCHEFHLRQITFKRQQPVPIYYKGVRLASDLWLDLLVHEKVIVDNKAKDEVTPLDKVRLLTYLRLCNLRLGLIINFHALRLTEGIVRVVNGLDEYHPPATGSFRL
jgi:GxxExxY protein